MNTPTIRSLALANAALFLVVPGASMSNADILVSTYTGQVLKFNESGYDQTPTVLVNDPTHLFAASGVTMGPDGGIYVSNYGTGTVLKYDGSGNFQSYFAFMPNDPADGGESPGSPAHVQFYGGDLYVSDNYDGSAVNYASTVERFTVAKNLAGELIGTAFANHAVTGLYGGAGGFTFGQDGYLYAADFGFASSGHFEAPAVVRVTPGGVQTNFAYPQFSEFGVSPAAPNGVLRLKDGLLVTDLPGNNIIKYDSNGQNPTVWATIPPPQAPGESNFPSDMVFSRDGKSVLVAVLGETQFPYVGSVLEYDLNGNLLGTIASDLPISSSLALTVSTEHLKGDLNSDGIVNGADIPAIQTALSNLQYYQDFYNLAPDELKDIADTNSDNKINGADMQFLVNYVLNGGGAAEDVPEPTAFVLASIGLAAIGLHIYRRPRRG